VIVKQAPASGFHAIGLSFPKPINPPNLCRANADESFEQARLSVIDGGDDTPFITVAPADSIVNRLSKLLAHLSAQYPADGWAGYLHDGTPRWAAMRLVGHSEGGAHGALMAHAHEVARLCLFEAPIDLIGAPGAARRLSTMAPRTSFIEAWRRIG
jgi:hypothetical protein